MNENGTETAWVDEEFGVDLSDILLDDGDGADQPDADNRGAEAPQRMGIHRKPRRKQQRNKARLLAKRRIIPRHRSRMGKVNRQRQTSRSRRYSP